MGDHIHRAAGGLVRRKGAGKAGIEHRELWPQGVGLGSAPLQIPLLPGDDTAVASLTAGGGEGEHRAHRQGMLRHIAAAVKDLPEIPLIHRAKGDGLCRVDDAAAAKGQDEVQVFPAHQLDALVDLAAARIGLHAPKLHEGKVRFLQRVGDGLIGVDLLHAAAAHDQKDAAAAKAAHQSAGLLLLPVAKGKVGGGIKGEIIHINTLSFGPRTHSGAVRRRNFSGPHKNAAHFRCGYSPGSCYRRHGA